MSEPAMSAPGAPPPKRPTLLVGLSMGGVGGWSRLWARMCPDDRHRACEAYLEDAVEHPGAFDAAVATVAAETKSRPATVRRMGTSKIAARLSKAHGLPDPYLHSFVVSLHRRRRLPMLTRFLDIAGIPHDAGRVDVSTASEPAPLERLLAAVEAITAEFPAEQVTLYLDALELEGKRAWSKLSSARDAAAKRANPDGKETLSA